MDSLLPVFNTASEVGYGGTIAALPAFAVIKDRIAQLRAEQPAGLGSRRDFGARWHHRLGFGRLEHRPGESWRDVLSNGPLNLA